MKYLPLFFLLIQSLTYAQTPECDTKVCVYHDETGRLYTKRQVDSTWYKANQFVITRKTKESADTIYFLFQYFDKSLLPDRYEQIGSFCGNQDRKKQSDIRKVFPYKMTKTIKLVSFKRPPPDSLFLEREIPKTNGRIDLSKMFEVKDLDKEQARKMLDVLFNYNNTSDTREVLMCYEPRNGIVFLDKSDNILGYIEICFECWNIKVEPKEIVLGDFCREKFDVVQGIFMKAGITYGMTGMNGTRD